jgi:hypothetical protein
MPLALARRRNAAPPTDQPAAEHGRGAGVHRFGDGWRRLFDRTPRLRLAAFRGQGRGAPGLFFTLQAGALGGKGGGTLRVLFALGTHALGLDRSQAPALLFLGMEEFGASRRLPRHGLAFGAFALGSNRGVARHLLTECAFLFRGQALAFGEQLLMFFGAALEFGLVLATALLQFHLPAFACQAQRLRGFSPLLLPSRPGPGGANAHSLHRIADSHATLGQRRAQLIQSGTNYAAAPDIVVNFRRVRAFRNWLLAGLGMTRGWDRLVLGTSPHCGLREEAGRDVHIGIGGACHPNRCLQRLGHGELVELDHQVGFGATRFQRRNFNFIAGRAKLLG